MHIVFLVFVVLILLLLVQGFDKRGFVWYTNFESRKSQEMAHNPYGALSFWWSEVQRAVRIEGVVCKVRDNICLRRAAAKRH